MIQLVINVRQGQPRDIKVHRMALHVGRKTSAPHAGISSRVPIPGIDLDGSLKPLPNVLHHLRHANDAVHHGGILRVPVATIGGNMERFTPGEVRRF
jgi:hypothetical protein